MRQAARETLGLVSRVDQSAEFDFYSLSQACLASLPKLAAYTTPTEARVTVILVVDTALRTVKVNMEWQVTGVSGHRIEYIQREWE